MDAGSLPFPGVLNEQHCEACTLCLQSCAETDRLLDAIAGTGLDVSVPRAKNAEQRAFATQTKRIFFPGEP
jgi:hypothetical protein